MSENLLRLLFGEDTPAFLAEVALRTAIMFIVVLTALRLLGKRGVKQLSVFELVVIITLGSAAGDPMFYKDVGLLPAIGVFIMIVLLYRLMMFLLNRSSRVEKLLEGEPVCLILDGRFSISNFKKETLALDEFFAELRLKNVSQLGQIERGLIETSGELSLLFYPDDQVRYGLPIWPGEFEYKNAHTVVPESGKYACTFCGNCLDLAPGPHTCNECQHHHWVEATDRKRIT